MRTRDRNPRDNQNLVYGIHAVFSVLNKHPDDIIKLAITEPALEKLNKQLLSSRSKTISSLRIHTRAQLTDLIGHEKHQGVVAFLRHKAEKYYQEKDLNNFTFNNNLILALDQIQDPRNLGACIRSAVAFGVDAVLIPKRGGCGITDVTHKTAAGTVDSINVFEITNLVRALETLKQAGFWVVGMSEKTSSDIYKTQFTQPTVIVLGAEGAGLRLSTQKCCDYLAKIPITGVSSLNVSVATGIALSEVIRQRGVDAKKT
ncbi:MAG: 23S rRNA (guanosine(2251)-2'-O)-methyltransferase RlmB [Thiotrichales bacterium]|nr:MAG: 23S rRNA (guanosine(2251)-2'-O)-methyltransferase RlmB [Thiotrichales bacterium]